MDKQQRPPRVTGVAWRCEPCSRSLGRHAPALVILERVGGPHPWKVHLLATWGRFSSDATWRSREEWAATRETFSKGRPRVRSRMLPGPNQQNEYACRRCRHRPRVKAPELFALADQAVAEGRDYFYR